MPITLQVEKLAAFICDLCLVSSLKLHKPFTFAKKQQQDQWKQEAEQCATGDAAWKKTQED